MMAGLVQRGLRGVGSRLRGRQRLIGCRHSLIGRRLRQYHLFLRRTAADQERCHGRNKQGTAAQESTHLTQFRSRTIPHRLCRLRRTQAEASRLNNETLV